jgi:hypothetical protein
MREAHNENRTATIIVATLAFLGALSFAFAGVTIIENGMPTASTAGAAAVHSPG